MSKAIVNQYFRLIEKDIDSILGGIRHGNSRELSERTKEIISIFSSYISTIPEYSYYSNVENCNIGGRYATNATYRIFPVILTPYNLRLLETIAPHKVYSLKKNEFLWGERWKVAPEIYRDVPDKEIFYKDAKFLFDINKIYEQGLIPSCFGSLYPYITEKYDEWLREKLTHGDPRIFEDLKEKVCDYWKFELQSNTTIVEYRHALFRLNKEEMEKDYPKLYEATMNHIKGGFYSFANRESKFGTRITNKEMEEYVKSLKRIIDV